MKKPDRETLFRLYVEDRQTTNVIGMQYGVKAQCVSKWLRKDGIQIRRRGPQRGELHFGWKGGVTTDKSGYLLRYAPNHPEANNSGYVREHRLVMEKEIGRYLLPTEVLHHRDDDVSNNAILNLELFDTNADHLATTLKGKCPNWTEAGRESLRRSADKMRQVFPDDLLEQYQTKSSRQIADDLGCTMGCVLDKLHSLGAKIRPQCRPRTIVLPDNLLELRKQFPSTRQLALHLGVNLTTVRERLTEMGAPPDTLDIEFPAKDEMEKLYETHNTKQLATRFECSQSCVAKHLKRLGIPAHPQGWPHSKPLPPDDELRRMLAATENVAGLARSLGVSKHAIYHWMKKHGVAARTKESP